MTNPIQTNGGHGHAPGCSCPFCQTMRTTAEVTDVDLAPSVKCSCAHHTDGSTTTSMCPTHADTDPCLRMSQVTGRRRVGSIKSGTCTNCGWTEPTPTAPVVPLTPMDSQHLAANRGRFEDGYTDDDINSVLGGFESAYLVCAWEKFDDYGFGGSSEIVGRAKVTRPAGPFSVHTPRPTQSGQWLRIHPDVWDVLSNPDSDVDPESIPSLLDTTSDFSVYERQDIADLPGNDHNVAFEGGDADDDEDDEETCIADDCDESLDDGEGFDGYCGTHADKIEGHNEGRHRALGKTDDDGEPAEGPDAECPNCNGAGVTWG